LLIDHFDAPARSADAAPYGGTATPLGVDQRFAALARQRLPRRLELPEPLFEPAHSSPLVSPKSPIRFVDEVAIESDEPKAVDKTFDVERRHFTLLPPAHDLHVANAAAGSWVVVFDQTGHSSRLVRRGRCHHRLGHRG
jgi:hypothetical protein